MTACECLWYILDSNYKETAEEKIYEMAIDSAPTIKSKLLRICKEISLSHKELFGFSQLTKSCATGIAKPF